MAVPHTERARQGRAIRLRRLISRTERSHYSSLEVACDGQQCVARRLIGTSGRCVPWIAACFHDGYVHGVSAAVLGRGGHQLTRDTAWLEARINGNHLHGPRAGVARVERYGNEPNWWPVDSHEDVEFSAGASGSDRFCLPGLPDPVKWEEVRVTELATQGGEEARPSA